MFWNRKKRIFPTRTIEQLKNSVNILFVDNEVFNLTTELKDKEGWGGSLLFRTSHLFHKKN